MIEQSVNIGWSLEQLFVRSEEKLGIPLCSQDCLSVHALNWRMFSRVGISREVGLGAHVRTIAVRKCESYGGLRQNRVRVDSGQAQICLQHGAD